MVAALSDLLDQGSAPGLTAVACGRLRLVPDRYASDRCAVREPGCWPPSTGPACSAPPTCTWPGAWPQLGGEADERVTLAAALAVRAPRFGHVYVDLEAVRHTAADEDDELDLGALPWPDAGDWIARLADSGMVAAGRGRPRRPPAPPDRDAPCTSTATGGTSGRWPSALLARAGDSVPAVDEAALAAGLARLFPDGADEPRWAAATAVLRRLCVIAGGPGSGKTTTLARVVALLDEQADDWGEPPPPLVGLAAPTGKAAARLEEAVHAEALRARGRRPRVRRHLLSLRASTLHRLLGVRPDSASRFRHHRHHRLPHDVIIVDETSMVALSLMARLIEAVRPDARLILVGDPEQLASVEAGAVLGDIVGPALERPRMTHRSEHSGGSPVPPRPPGAQLGGASPGRPQLARPRLAASRVPAHRPPRPARRASATPSWSCGPTTAFGGPWRTWLRPSGPATPTGPSGSSRRATTRSGGSKWTTPSTGPAADGLARAPADPGHGHLRRRRPVRRRQPTATATRPSMPSPGSGCCVPTATARPG